MAEIDSENKNGEHGGDTAMFQAFVNSSEKYQEHAGSKGPIVVAVVALVIAVIAFVVIVAVG